MLPSSSVQTHVFTILFRQYRFNPRYQKEDGKFKIDETLSREARGFQKPARKPAPGRPPFHTHLARTAMAAAQLLDVLQHPFTSIHRHLKEHTEVLHLHAGILEYRTAKVLGLSGALRSLRVHS